MTTTSDPSIGTEPRVARLPAWLVVLLILLALTLASWLAWRQWFAAPSESAEFDVGTISDRYQVLRRPGPVQPRVDLTKEGVHPLGANTFYVSSGEFFMRLAPTETTFAPIRLMTNRQNLISADQRALLGICRDSSNPGFAKTIEITPDQAKKLTALRAQANGAMKIDEADRTKLRALWKSWNDAKDPAAKTATEAPLLTAMKEIGARCVEPTKQQYAQVTAEVRKVVTDTQIAKYRQMRGL